MKLDIHCEQLSDARWTELLPLIQQYEVVSHLKVNSGEGDGTPLQYSCLENPMDGGAW